jgi:multidrug efflux pump subunit AcrA (membrane-fusion protein)
MPSRWDDASPPYLDRAAAPWAIRGLAVILIALFAAGVLGAVAIRVPETVSSRFVLVPLQGVDQIRAARDGTVTEVRADEAQPVAKGDRMFVIRSVAIGDRSAELGALETRLAGNAERRTNERSKYESQRLADDEEERRLAARLAHIAGKIEEQQSLRSVRQARYRATLAIYENEIEITRRELEYKHGHLAVAKELADRSARLHEAGIVSWLEHKNRQLEAGKLAIDLQQLDRQLDSGRLKISQLKNDEARHDIEWKLTLDQLTTDRKDIQAASDKLHHEAAARRTAFAELDRSLTEETKGATIRIAALRTELAQSSGSDLSIPAPCSGTVVRLGIHGPGAVVKQGEVLGELACAGGRLQAEITVPLAGVGRISEGQPVKLLYDAFPYQRYGVRHGAVRWVSPSSVGAARVFRAFADVDDTAVTVKGEPRPLRPGMGGRADVVVGRRALITYAFEPLRQLRESLADAPSGRK